MSTKTGIQWTDHTFNPWWGCIRVSPGCQNCYAETLSKRFGHDLWGPAQATERRTFGAKHWLEPLRWNARAEVTGQRERVFCASMADVFEDHPALPPERDRLFDLIEQTPRLDWQLLTKRPENIWAMVPALWHDQPRRNVWFGTSVEDQARAPRVTNLLTARAAVRFLSIEPLIERLDLSRELWIGGISWAIIGGESGPYARPCDLDWIRDLIRQCRAAGVKPFVKQLGSVWAKANGAKHGHGGNPDEWPDDLRVREFPEASQ